jgi:hypothetical protein
MHDTFQDVITSIERGHFTIFFFFFGNTGVFINTMHFDRLYKFKAAGKRVKTKMSQGAKEKKRGASKTRHLNTTRSNTTHLSDHHQPQHWLQEMQP